MQCIFRTIRPLKAAAFTGFGALVCLAAESLGRGSVSAALGWGAEQPLFLACNLLLCLAFLGLCLALTGRLAAAMAGGGLLLLAMAAVNAAKLSVLGTPFLAWDLLFARQMWAMLATLSPSAAAGLLAAAALPAVLLGVIVRCGGGRLGATFRLVLGLACLGLLARSDDLLARRAGMANVIWNQAENAAANGFFATFALNVSPLLVQQPEVYDEEVVARILEHNSHLASAWERDEAAPPVSLVVVMSESFYDMADMGFEADDLPLETVSRIVSEHPSFRLVSPSFGGNTCNVEFEVLTGLSNAFLPDGSLPYDHYIRRPTPSLAWVLGGLGYRTAAVHPYHDWFWNRKRVYPLLGFSEFHALDSFGEADKRGGLVSDEAMVDRIIGIIDETDGPFFIHAVSMQNHGPYPEDRYGEDAVQVPDKAPAAMRGVLGTFMTNLRDADRALAKLLERLERHPGPVLCLFFGDHQPWFMLDVHNAAANGEGRAQHAMYSVPGLLWSNTPGLVDRDEIPERLSPVYFPPILLHQMRIPLPPHMLHLRAGMGEFPVIHRAIPVGGEDEAQFPARLREVEFLRSLEVLQYDILFGKRFQEALAGPRDS